MKTAAHFWDKIAPKYAKSLIGDVAAYEYTLERTQSYLGPEDSVLELGCGTGTTAARIAPGVGHILATDVSSGMIAFAQEKAQDHPNMECAVLGAVPTEGLYQAVLGFSFFHLVPDMEARFRQIHELLPTGGYFISKTPCLAEPSAGIKGVLIRLAIPVMRLIGKAPYVRLFSIAALEAAIAEAGFEIVESGTLPAGPPPARYVVARKPAAGR